MSVDILDQEESLNPLPDPGLRRRAVRFLVYCIGILGVIWYRYYLVIDEVQRRGDLEVEEIAALLQNVFPIGAAAVWLFSGLGLVAVIQALAKQRTDFWWIVLGLVHALLFAYYSFNLLNYFAIWSSFSF